jgi:hypothetical protein
MHSGPLYFAELAIGENVVSIHQLWPERVSTVTGLWQRVFENTIGSASFCAPIFVCESLNHYQGIYRVKFSLDAIIMNALISSMSMVRGSCL